MAVVLLPPCSHACTHSCRCDTLKADTIGGVVHEVLVSWLLTSIRTEDADLIVRCLCLCPSQCVVYSNDMQVWVCRCDGYCVKPPYLYVVMEMCPQDCLMDVLAKERLPLLSRLEIAHDFLRSIAHMHSIGFVHRDVKSLNCFMTMVEGRLGVRLGDFGESVTIVAAEGEDPMQVGTPQW